MTRTEERLADALAARATAVAADSIRPLPVASAARWHRHLAGRRWSVSLAPLAAAASIAAITAVVAMLPAHHTPGHALAGLPKNSSLLGVTAVSASDAWAVGLVISRRTIPLIMHWNGTHWTRSRISTGATSGFLWGVAAASARDAWAVGAGGGRGGPFILHWNGSMWTPVPTPRIAAAELSAVTAVSATDAWAVGLSDGALILHWNGTRWRNVPNPWRGGHTALYGVFARSAHDVWAVGKAGSNSLILHWNGVSWTRLGGPKYGRYGSSIWGVAAVSSRLTWLVGQAKDRLPLILRWNGNSLRQLPRPKPTARGALNGVSSVSAGRAWAVGTGGHGGARTWIFRWQGHGWLRVPSPARRVAGVLRAVYALSAKNAWAVGFSGLAIGVRSRGFILHWNGTSWQPAA
jgi:hypothetical protein